MNHFMHPDTFYEYNRQYHKERLEASRRKRSFTHPKSTGENLKDQLFLQSGELFIAFGENLKSRVAHPVCKPRVA
jgi:hypothetical protein